TMSCPTALRLCYAFGSNIDVARCGWDVRIKSNSKEMFRYAQHDKWRCDFSRTHHFICAVKTAPPNKT
ncbi:MAG: hypothetical protein K2N54_03720, partial [Helicobacter sp.]|nr:hypothetical protein [Helicobacter sp.]